VKFFNTLTRTKEEFVPLNPPHVGMYTCGPTVYDFVHIGNLRAFAFDDLLRRWLEYRGYDVTHVMNITDVEDRIINKVRETGSTLEEVTGINATRFLLDLDALNIKRAHITPRATESIDGMIAMIKKLIAANHAYIGDDKCVYYSIKSFPEYGKLSHRRVGDQCTAVARIKNDDYDKEEMADFALWKAWDEKDGDVKWDSPWGPGRPGWHIECSVMSMQHLGETFDIHCGGEDLIFPHHEDEIAQSEAVTGKPFVRYWLHNSHLLVEGKKMSKRLGNVYTLHDLAEKGWTGREIRYVLLSAHYREQLNFTIEGLHAARSALQRIHEFLKKLWDVAGSASPLESSGTCESLTTLKTQFEASLDDDLNISPALGAVFDFIRDVNKRLSEQSISSGEAALILNEWKKLDGVLGLGIPTILSIPADVNKLAKERDTARRAKDFKRADELRTQLAAMGWVVKDEKDGFSLKRAQLSQ
jgi:cysteinyl-tRNA synthetase